MRYGVAALMTVFMLFAVIALAGAGHGWGSGASGCLALAPVTFFAWVNALGRKPSFRGAIAVLVLVVAISVGVGVATESEGSDYFFEYFDVNGILGVSIAFAAYFNAVVASAVAIIRIPRTAKATRSL